MSEFDALMVDAHTALFSCFGDAATLTDLAANDYSISVVIDRNVEVVIDDMVQFYDLLVTLDQPPAGVSNGWTVISEGITYILLERVEKDPFVERWAARKG